MRDQILDDDFLIKKKITSKEDIKKRLKEAGINSFFEHKNGTIIVEQGDAVKVVIHYENNEVRVESKFPQIGNSIQVVASGVLLAIFIFVIPVVFPMPWIIAIIGGQIISYMVHSPKTKKFKERIEKFV